MKTKDKKIIYPSFERYLAKEMSNKAFEKAYKKESQCFKIADAFNRTLRIDFVK